MASTAAGIQAIIDAIDDLILAKLQGADISKFRLGEEEVTKYSIAELRAMRKDYAEQLEAISSGTEYWDVFDDGVDKLTGRDTTIGIGDLDDE